MQNPPHKAIQGAKFRASLSVLPIGKSGAYAVPQASLELVQFGTFPDHAAQHVSIQTLLIDWPALSLPQTLLFTLTLGPLDFAKELNHQWSTT